MLPFFVLINYLASAAPVLGRVITIKNSCSTTLWPGHFAPELSRPDFQQAASQGGFQLESGQSYDLTVPDHWEAGRIWARTDCTSESGAFHCGTGDCGPALECNPGATGAPPASLAEFTLFDDEANVDWYDISLVDGFNVPIAMTPSKAQEGDNCRVLKCAANLNDGCPPELSVAGGTGCMTACTAVNLSPAIGYDQERVCCAGRYQEDPQGCTHDGIPHYNHFKDACPDAYAYAYDEKSGSALFTCDWSGGRSDYTVEFCPEGADYRASAAKRGLHFRQDRQ